MRNFKSFLFYTACISMLVFASCKKKKGPEPDPPGKIQANKLAGTWTPDFNTNDEAITYNGQSRAADFGSFRLSIEAGASADADGIWGGSYTASGQPDGEGQVIWPESGRWKFPSATETGSMVRDNKVNISIVVTDETLKLTFTVPDPNATPSARVAGFFDSPWVFTLTKQQ